jgi:soluble lytic murein transglycosylase-like protein
MTTKDWIYISLISIGVMILTRKAFSSEANPSIVNALENANPAGLPITLTADELRVMSYADIMMYEGQRQGIAPEIIAGIMKQEAGKENSITPETIKVSGKNVKTFSYGLMQVLFETANDLKRMNPSLKYDNNPLTLLKPDVNIEMGAYYLSNQYKRYTKKPVLNTITDTIASYNAGTAFIAGEPYEYYYTNSIGDPKVNTYVDNVVGYKFRFRMMFEYLYSNYDDLFPASIWGH